MNNKELLEVAVGMGFDCASYTDLDASDEGKKEIVVINPETNYFEEFNPSVEELMWWLLDKGNVDCHAEGYVSFYSRYDTFYMHSRENTLKENLLQIILQVVRYEL